MGYKVTDSQWLVTKLYPLEVMAGAMNVVEVVAKDKESEPTDGAEKKGESNLAWTYNTIRPTVRDSVNRAKEWMMKWSKILSSPRGCQRLAVLIT